MTQERFRRLRHRKLVREISSRLLGSFPGGQPLAAGLLVTLLALAVFGTSPAKADFPSDVPDRFKIQAGGVNAQFDTQGSLALTDGPAGVFINFEDVFDLPLAKSAWTLEGFWRFSEKGYLDFGYVDFSREAGHVLEQDVEWGDATFQANALVSAKFSTKFTYAAYRHDFLQLEQVHISGSAGFSYLRLGSGLAADGGVIDSNGNPITGSFEQEANVAFPVPLVGLQLDWKLTRHTAVQLYTRILRIDFQNFRGGITQTAARYEWYANRHFAIGGGFSKYEINLRRYETGDFTARFSYLVTGLELYLKLAF